MPVTKSNSILRETVSLVLGIGGLLIAIFVFLLKMQYLTVPGMYLADQDYLFVTLGALFLCTIMLLLNTLGAITHIWGNN